jgi:hypothetical protein
MKILGNVKKIDEIYKTMLVIYDIFKNKAELEMSRKRESPVKKSTKRVS